MTLRYKVGDVVTIKQALALPEIVGKQAQVVAVGPFLAGDRNPIEDDAYITANCDYLILMEGEQYNMSCREYNLV